MSKLSTLDIYFFHILKKPLKQFIAQAEKHVSLLNYLFIIFDHRKIYETILFSKPLINPITEFTSFMILEV